MGTRSLGTGLQSLSFSLLFTLLPTDWVLAWGLASSEGWCLLLLRASSERCWTSAVLNLKSEPELNGFSIEASLLTCSSGRDKICMVWNLETRESKRTVPIYEVKLIFFFFIPLRSFIVCSHGFSSFHRQWSVVCVLVSTDRLLLSCLLKWDVSPLCSADVLVNPCRAWKLLSCYLKKETSLSWAWRNKGCTFSRLAAKVSVLRVAAGFRGWGRAVAVIPGMCVIICVAEVLGWTHGCRVFSCVHLTVMDEQDWSGLLWSFGYACFQTAKKSLNWRRKVL